MGKSALVHSSAAALGVSVIEIGTDQCRAGAHLKRLALEATRSRSIALAGPASSANAAGNCVGVGVAESLDLLFFDEASPSVCLCLCIYYTCFYHNGPWSRLLISIRIGIQ